MRAIELNVLNWPGFTVRAFRRILDEMVLDAMDARCVSTRALSEIFADLCAMLSRDV